jgi:hypothetical protein
MKYPISWHNLDFTDFSTKPKSARMPVHSRTVLLSKCFYLVKSINNFINKIIYIKNIL